MFWYFLSKVLKEANRLKVNIDDLLLYDKEKIKQDVYEAGVKRRKLIEIAINFLKNTNLTFQDIVDNTDLVVYEIKRPIFFGYDVIELRWGYKIWMNLKNMEII